MEFDQLDFMWKTNGSNTGNCPALYKVDGGYVVQGKTLGDGTVAKLRDLGGDEGAVFVPDDVLDGLRIP